MTLPLLKTKFYVPDLRSSFIMRPRLIDVLNHELIHDEGFTRKLSLIGASAGYGKTSLTIDWLSTLEMPVSWLSLGENDNDPVHFLTYLVNAFRQVLVEVRSLSLGMLQFPFSTPQSAFRAELDSLLFPFGGKPGASGQCRPRLPDHED